MVADGQAIESIGLGAQIQADSGRFPILLFATILISLMVVTINRLI
jgi:NitT/TauT family transport system permease protein